MFRLLRWKSSPICWVVIILFGFTFLRIFSQMFLAENVTHEHDEKKTLTKLLTMNKIVPMNISLDIGKSAQNKFEILEMDGETDATDAEELDGNCSASFRMKGKAHSDINMMEMYDQLAFDDKRQYGDWQIRWKIKVDNLRFNEANKLNVFLLPHSHNDPGWTSTFEHYYERSVREILDLMLQNLYTNPSIKFIWAEMSFFSLWWNEISQEKKLALKMIVERKQLEFVTGGWVMPDEANSHFYSILIQLIEGNLWLKQHLNYVPRNGWSIDPFGLSPTMAYILKRSGFQNMLIQRTHYLVKQYLGNRQELEFFWRQSWDNSGSTDILTHMEPFSSYTTVDTCGPDRNLCRTFDYRERFSPYSTAMDITASNIEKRSSDLVRQYKKKAMLFKSNNVLVPIGSDFAWSSNLEWNDMSRNYGNISTYVNQRFNLHTQIRYGTLDEYFSAVNSEFDSKKINLSKLSGDFFTYADKNDHYWSGYYTSRPFHKAFERRLISYLRSAHLSYTFLNAELSKRSGELTQFPFMKTLFWHLRNARRTLSLFQHHDGITGTSKDYVMKDYAEKLDAAVSNCSYVMEKSIEILTQIRKDNALKELQNQEDPQTLPLKFQTIFEKVPIYTLPTLQTIPLSSSKSTAIVTVFNSLAQMRTTLVSLKISIPEEDDGAALQVTDTNGKVSDSELFPVFGINDTISKNVFWLNFVATQEAITINNFVISLLKLKGDESRTQNPKVYLVAAADLKISLEHKTFETSILQPDAPINISNGRFSVNFDSNGFMDKLSYLEKDYHLKIGMFTYGTSFHSGTPSGLYLFLPDGPASPIDIFNQPLIKIVKGRLKSFVEVSLPLVQHRITIYNHSGIESNAIEIANTVDLSSKWDLELMMRIESNNVSSGNLSYTDLNAFQMIERKRFESMPMQGHYYPMPSATYIEDPHLRLTVLGGQPVGTASLESGKIDLVMDRTLIEDDGLGVGQGSGAAIKNVNAFKLLLEITNCKDSEKEEKAPMLSLGANLLKNELLHPLQIFRGVSTENDSFLSLFDYGQHRNIPCDVEFIDAIPQANFPDPLDDIHFSPTAEAAVLVRRFGFDARFHLDSNFAQCSSTKTKLGHLSFDGLFPNMLQRNVTQMSLTFLHELQKLESTDEYLLDPMEIYAFHVAFQNKSRQ